MKRLLAAALLIGSLQAQAAASTADEEAAAKAAAEAAAAEASKAKDGATAAPAGSEAPPPPQLNGLNYGTFAIVNGQQLTGDELKDLPLEAQWAMSKGLSPVLSPDKKSVLGYDVNPMESRLASAVAKDFAKYTKDSQLGPGEQGPCPQFVNCHSSEPNQLPPAAESDPFANMAANPKNHCEQPGPPPPCLPPEKKKEDPMEVAEKEKEQSEKEADEALANGDDAAGIAALTKRNEAEDKMNAGGKEPPLQTPGTDLASRGSPTSYPGITGGQGQGIGAQGQVGGDPFADAKQVRADPALEWAAKKREKEGMLNPLLTPSGPAISVAERMRRGFDGTFSTLLGYKDELLGKAAAVEANPDADLTAGEATSAIVDGARTNAPVIRVTKCGQKKDMLDGTAGDRVLKSPHGC